MNYWEKRTDVSPWKLIDWIFPELSNDGNGDWTRCVPEQPGCSHWDGDHPVPLLHPLDGK
jgi:hypothetical protein